MNWAHAVRKEVLLLRQEKCGGKLQSKHSAVPSVFIQDSDWFRPPRLPVLCTTAESHNSDDRGTYQSVVIFDVRHYPIENISFWFYLTRSSIASR
ncbi:hypothetical protein J6590_071738 [Homalodisca vitripennis]|nr:hypothetical protein J6590_071738 [Homalodisca vitripennis]